jgi:hypothetical protein
MQYVECASTIFSDDLLVFLLQDYLKISNHEYAHARHLQNVLGLAGQSSM